MALFVIGDLHLALSVSNKKMDIFGGWENYMELLEKTGMRIFHLKIPLCSLAIVHGL